MSEHLNNKFGPALIALRKMAKQNLSGKHSGPENKAGVLKPDSFYLAAEELRKTIEQAISRFHRETGHTYQVINLNMYGADFKKEPSAVHYLGTSIRLKHYLLPETISL